MQIRQEKTVYGYVERNYKEIMPKEIIELILKFYLLYFDTKIMTDDEQLSLVNLIWNKLKKSDGNQDMKGVTFDLLYRGSENGYLASKFHEKCDEKGATVTVIHNTNDFIFGGYASKSWPKTEYMTRVRDPNAFLFTIKPEVKIFGLAKVKAHYKHGQDAISSHVNFGPVFGIGTDLYRENKCGDGDESGCSYPKTYDMTRKEFIGVSDENTSSFKINEYEVFRVSQQR